MIVRSASKLSPFRELSRLRVPPSRKRLLNPVRPLFVGGRQTGKKVIGFRLKILSDLSKRGHGKGMLSPLDIAERLGVDAQQLGKAFLGEAGTQPCRPDVLPDDAK